MQFAFADRGPRPKDRRDFERFRRATAGKLLLRSLKFVEFLPHVVDRVPGRFGRAGEIQIGNPERPVTPWTNVLGPRRA